MPNEKLSNATHWKVFFNNLKQSQLIYHSDVKAAIHQNEDIILYIEIQLDVLMYVLNKSIK